MEQHFETQQQKEQVILVAVATQETEFVDESLDELEELVRTAGGECVGRLIQNRIGFDTASYIGQGKIEELRYMICDTGATGIVCDDELSPMQMRNLEEALDTKIMDRTMVILDIFAGRASTREGKIQVELAQLKYQSSRLVGLRSSLSRLGGGIGTRGPGETKIEMDRRVIRDRISKLSREVEEVKKHREVQRKQRKKQGVPVACIVGYTNAGKSTLLNHLTNAGILEEDLLFATLDPTTRGLVLPGGKLKLLITDTVGFIRKLPHQLISAFRSTLEEAKYADMIIHVVDCSNPQMDMQMHVVYETLRELGIQDKPIITVFNKIDNVPEAPVCKDLCADELVWISAKHERGFDELYQALERMIRKQRMEFDQIFSYADMKQVSRIREQGEILEEEYLEMGIRIHGFAPSELLVRKEKKD